MMSETDTDQQNKVSVQAALGEDKSPQVVIGESETRGGTLSGNNERVSFVDESGREIDVLTDGIVASEYEPPSILTDWIVYGVLIGVPGLLALAIVTGIYEPAFLNPVLSIEFVADVVLPVGAVVGTLLGGLYIALAIFGTHHTLAIHTAAKTYTFTSKNSEIQRVQEIL